MKNNPTKQPGDQPVIRKVSRGYQITLPPEFREKNRLSIGDHVRIEQQGEILIITAVSDKRQRLADELLAALHEPLEGVPEVQDEAEAMRMAIREIKRYRHEQRKKSSRRA